ncbi:Cytochrome p450 [Thalictrum thalictroides]|uniref:Cytochrome p450 n=1 Tax=Thalictrum thalictroides TaxID=46969 RepID=A0A7J6WJN6_THATH|nr:Cytochrome p450 [Thalictrum thalictroides]
MKRFGYQKTNSKLPPGPWKLPVIGHLHHLRGLLPHHTLRDLSRKHGPLMLLQLGEVLSIVVSSPRLAKEVLKTNELVFANRGSVLIGEIVTYNGEGIVFSPYGGKWKQLRKICMVELLSAKKTQSFLPMMEEELKLLVKDVSLMAGTPVNFSQKLFSLMNDITSRAAFGKKYVEEATLLSLVKDVVGLATGFALPDVFPSVKFIHRICGARRRVEKLHEQIDKILEDIMNDHRMKRKASNSSKNKMEEDLVDVLLRLQEEDKHEFRIENNCIKAVILEMFMAGSESLSTTTEWALSEMLRTPRVMKKAQAEVRLVLDGKRKVSQSDVNELSYLKKTVSVFKDVIYLARV